jgi:serine protease Do
VVAIGSPFGFENSVTAGIVSGTSRVLPDGAYTPFIQTDVAVNPGNSGGPLFDMSGRVIGINSQIYSRTGGYMGVSFAIPIDVAINVKDQLVKTGKVQRGRIGVVIQDVNQQLADSFGLDRPRGALVSSVEADGPGEKAGIKAGDVIVAVDGRPIDRSSQLPSTIASLAPGSKATLEVWRDRAARRLVVTIGQLQDERVATSDAPGSAKGKLGLSLRPLTPAESRAAGVKGLLVEDVSGAALAAGVQQGDVLIGVNGQRVTTVEQMRDIVARSGKSVALLISRDGQQLFLPVRPG